LAALASPALLTVATVVSGDDASAATSTVTLIADSSH
jgi:hypothetical protein